MEKTSRRVDPDDTGCNDSANPTFESVLAARFNRRDFLKTTSATGAMAVFGGVGLSTLAACAHDDEDSDAGSAAPLLGFAAVAKGLDDAVVLPGGYRYTVLCALGDPLAASIGEYRNDGTDGDFESRFGDHHDGMEYFGLSSSGVPDANNNDRALIGLNHEATTDETRSSLFLHANGGTTTLPRPAAEVDKEMALHGISVFEIVRGNAGFTYVRNSAYNFRVHQNSEVDIYGPARGSALLVTKYSPGATRTRGTLNNCGTGKTPWGTLLTGEENWAGYFTRGATDNAARGNDKSVVALNRYGRAQGAASRHGWESAGSDDKYARWNIGRIGVSADGSDDYRNELNTMGYVVEFDPYEKTRNGRKRTALGRFAHEAAAFSAPVSGKPLAIYMGDDSRGEYIYKYVSAALWNAADASPVDRLATGDKYLDNGKLYVAKFNADGSGQWIELTLSNTAIAGYATYSFADQADVVVNARLAADAVGATKMDRPEWGRVNPANGEVYMTLTNNSNRRLNPTASQMAPDAANPRVYSDTRAAGTASASTSTGNVNGHIIRFREAGGEAAATSFSWDIYLFGAEAGADASVNLSGLSADQDFSSPDGLVFTPSTGICWIQTDDGAFTDTSNCMMLAALPGQVGDGGPLSVAATGVTTQRGALPLAGKLKRFLVGPVACEITGGCESPDGKALFVNIQHPGETTRTADVGDASKYTSHWPGNAGYGAGGASARPRSATIVITRNDGGKVGT